MDKVPSQALLQAGLETMRASGLKLQKQPSKGRSLIYALENGETVRVRTCNDHVLIVIADSPNADAKLNIEGTDHLLVVLAAEPRTPGNVLVYFVPTNTAISAARAGRKSWLSSNPITKGQNTPWNIWFDASGPDESHGYLKKWDRFRVDKQVSTISFLESAEAVHVDKSSSRDTRLTKPNSSPKEASTDSRKTGKRESRHNQLVRNTHEIDNRDSSKSLRSIIDQAREEIAHAAGVEATNVKIRIDID